MRNRDDLKGGRFAQINIVLDELFTVNVGAKSHVAPVIDPRDLSKVEFLALAGRCGVPRYYNFSNTRGLVGMHQQPAILQQLIIGQHPAILRQMIIQPFCGS